MAKPVAMQKVTPLAVAVVPPRSRPKANLSKNGCLQPRWTARSRLFVCVIANALDARTLRAVLLICVLLNCLVDAFVLALTRRGSTKIHPIDGDRARLWRRQWNPVSLRLP